MDPFTFLPLSLCFPDSSVARALYDNGFQGTWNMKVKWSTSGSLQLWAIFVKIAGQKPWYDCPLPVQLSLDPLPLDPRLLALPTRSPPKCDALSWFQSSFHAPPQPHGTECSSSNIKCSLLAPGLVHSVLFLECSPCSSFTWLLLIHHLPPWMSLPPGIPCLTF